MKAAGRLAKSVATRVWPKPDPRTRRVVLCYHSIHPSASYASATPTVFDATLDWLASECTVVPLTELRSRPSDGRPVVALTFDDGFADNWEYAAPSLLERDLHATFFLTTGFLERDPDVLARLATLWRTPVGSLTPLRWRDVSEMQRAGLSVGSHTWSHPNLASLDPTTAHTELRRSRDLLEQRLTHPVTMVAYPFGKPRHHVVAKTLAQARADGYTIGVTTSPRGVSETDDPLALPRLVLGDDTVAQVRAKVLGEIDWHAHARDRLPRGLSERSFSDLRMRR